MDVYLKLPGYAGSSKRAGYRGWLPIDELRFERPRLEKDRAVFTVYRTQDALSYTLAERHRSERPYSRIRIHHVEGSEPVARLRFDAVRVAAIEVDTQAYESTERVTFEAASWMVE